MMNFLMDSKSIEDHEIQSCSMSDPTCSDIDFKDQMAWVWTILKIFVALLPPGGENKKNLLQIGLLTF